MKKIAVLSSLLLVLSVLGVVFICITVNKESDRITFKVTDKYGDRCAAYGANISAAYEYSQNMYWSTEVKVGKTDCVSTEYDFKYRTNVTNSVNYSGVTPYSSMHYSLDRNSINAEGLDKAYKEIYDSTPYGTEKTVTVKIADYYDYYPVSVTIHIPGYTYRSFSTANREGYQSLASKAILDAFNDFFKIPVSDKDTIQITVDKDDSDGMASNTIHTNFYNLSSDCVLGENVCYIFINNSNYDNSKADTSLIHGGYGIYAIDYGKEYQYGVDLSSLRTVFTLPENEEVTKIDLREDLKLMYVFVNSSSGAYIYVLDTTSFTALQKIKTELPAINHITVGEDFFLLYYDERIEVVELKADGLCETAFSATTAYYVDNSYHGLYVSAAADYNGEKLICIDYLHEGRYRTLELCSFYVSVYDKTGLIYYGEYNCSLSANPNASSYSYNCLPDATNYISVKWD